MRRLERGPLCPLPTAPHCEPMTAQSPAVADTVRHRYRACRCMHEHRLDALHHPSPRCPRTLITLRYPGPAATTATSRCINADLHRCFRTARCSTPSTRPLRAAVQPHTVTTRSPRLSQPHPPARRAQRRPPQLAQSSTVDDSTGKLRPPSSDNQLRRGDGQGRESLHRDAPAPTRPAHHRAVTEAPRNATHRGPHAVIPTRRRKSHCTAASHIAATRCTAASVIDTGRCVPPPGSIRLPSLRRCGHRSGTPPHAHGATQRIDASTHRTVAPLHRTVAPTRSGWGHHSPATSAGTARCTASNRCRHRRAPSSLRPSRNGP